MDKEFRNVFLGAFGLGLIIGVIVTSIIFTLQ
ncbi:hypothetical protein LCGC14_2734730 [marine sediment metagenome]|uniref:Uncharacterized protein n=1 Tax=marine sediment metagenome TaxID=412755 RepID=A0A0F9BXT7_9ZZZZ